MSRPAPAYQNPEPTLPRWPRPLGEVDRSPQLQTEEVAAFAALFAPGSRATLATYAPALQRFREPIEAALRHCGHGRASERLRATCWLLYYEMHGRQRSLWGWSEADWVDIAGVSTAAFATAQPALKAAHHLAHTHFRTCVVACAYLLGEVNIYQRITEFRPLLAARRIFGPGAVHAAIAAVKAELGRIGRGSESLKSEIGNAVSLALLSNRSPALTDLTLPVLEQVLEQVGANKWLRRGCIQTSEALYMLGLLPRPLPAVRTVVTVRTGQQDTLPAAWAALIQRWSETTTVSPATRDGLRVSVAKAGRWAAHTFPTTADPAQWTAEMALAYVAAVVRMTGGEWNHPGTRTAAALVGKPLRPSSRAHLLSDLRIFFLDCQDWQWLPRVFNPHRCLATPASITALRGPDPRVIADDRWAKLLSAGLSLTQDDLPTYVRTYRGRPVFTRDVFYPLDMVRALVIVWLFAGLRASEIRRLRVGCTSPRPALAEDAAASSPAGPSVCLLHVPVNKTGPAFVKPVDYVVGEVVAAWERVRPSGPPQWDAKTGEAVHFLFTWRGKPIGATYLNHTLIPMLCRKAGVPEADARGNITSHRARSTIATQLYNAREPMTLLELQQWLGHRSPHATQYYAKLSPTRLTKAFTDAGYFGRNVRLIEVLIDQDVIRSGAAAAGEPWRYYDLGHGYCTYDFFDQCPHRMACAKCSFYRPKESSLGPMREARQHLLRLQQALPLTEQERAAVEEGVAALEKLTAQLQDTPTPQGPTPRELALPVPGRLGKPSPT